MNLTLTNIRDDIDWRTSELASIQTLVLRYKLQPRDTSIFLKCSIPMIYALWEGFVVSSLTAINSFINNSVLSHNEVDSKLLTHAIDTEINFHQARSSFDKKLEQVLKLKSAFDQPIKLSGKIDTKSNVNFNVVNTLLERYCIPCLPKAYEKRINKLLKFRNSIAHGDNSVPVKVEDVNEFAQLTLDLMHQIFDNIEIYLTNELFKKN